MLRTTVRLIYSVFAAVLLCATALAQNGLSDEAKAMLPDQLGDFRATAPALRPPTGGIFERAAPEDFGAVSEAVRDYANASGQTLSVRLIKTGTDGGAYSLLTGESNEVQVGCELGAACVFGESYVAFSKGTTYVVVSDGSRKTGSAAVLEVARRLATTLDAGAGSVPILAMHLPEWEQVKQWADYAVSLPALQSAAGRGFPALDALSFEGGTEAATASYSGAQVVVVEFTTPQYASDNDARINQRIAELRAAGQPVPTAYRREGNYAVFVFDAADERAANELLGQVKYEKDVRWLGRNPHEDEIRNAHVTSTMGGVIVTTLKVTGLAILLCLGVGGLFGGAVFLMRRSSAAQQAGYSDAGGMLRLNLEDADLQHDPSKLLNRGTEG